MHGRWRPWRRGSRAAVGGGGGGRDVEGEFHALAPGGLLLIAVEPLDGERVGVQGALEHGHRQCQVADLTSNITTFAVEHRLAGHDNMTELVYSVCRLQKPAGGRAIPRASRKSMSVNWVTQCHIEFVIK